MAKTKREPRTILKPGSLVSIRNPKYKNPWCKPFGVPMKRARAIKGPFKPNDQQRYQVIRGIAYGLTGGAIRHSIINPATGTSIGEDVYRAAFADEIAFGRELVVADIADAMLSQILLWGDVAAGKYLLATIAKWREAKDNDDGDGSDVKGGVLVVPGIVDPKEWEKASAQHQREMIESEHAAQTADEEARATPNNAKKKKASSSEASR